MVSVVTVRELKSGCQIGNNMYSLSNRSLKKLDGVHPDLVDVVKRAIEITEIDFGVSEGVRTLETQKEYLEKGVLLR